MNGLSTKTWVLATVVQLGLLAAAFGAGRLTAPASKATTAKAETKATEQAHAVKVAAPTTTIIRKVTRPPAPPPPPAPGCPACPECPAIEEETTTIEEHGPTTTTTDTTAEATSTSSTTTTTSYEYPRLTLGLGAGYPVDRFRLAAPELAGLAAYRPVGPFSLWAAGTRSYLVAGLAVTF